MHSLQPSCSEPAPTAGYVNTMGQIDLGVLIHAAHGSIDRLRHLSQEMTDAQKIQFLTNHFRPSPNDVLHSHPVTKQGRCWNATFQLRWLEQFPWLSYNNKLEGGLCRYCVLFPQQPDRGGSQGANPGVLVCSSYLRPYTKALGKNGILTSHDKSSMHCRAAEKADLFAQNFRNPDDRIDNQLLIQQNKQEQINKDILHLIVIAVEFLA